MSLELSARDVIRPLRVARQPVAVRVALLKNGLTSQTLAKELGVSESLLSLMFLGRVRGYKYRRAVAARLGLSLKQAFGDSRTAPIKECRYSAVIRDALRRRQINGRMIGETLGIGASLVSWVLTGGVRDRVRREQIASCLGLDPAEIWPDYDPRQRSRGGNVHNQKFHQENILVKLRSETSPLTAKQIGQLIGLAADNTRKHLESMVARGQVLRVRAPRGRRGYLYQILCDAANGPQN